MSIDHLAHQDRHRLCMLLNKKDCRITRRVNAEIDRKYRRRTVA